MERKKQIVRWLFAIGCFGFSGVLVKQGYLNLEASSLSFGILLFAIGAASIFSSLLEIATRPMMALIESIFLGGEKLNRPIKSLKLPRYYEKEERFDEALAEYEKVIRYYPDEPIAYEGAIRILVKEFDEYAQAEKIFSKSRRRHLILSDDITDLFPANHG